MESVKSLLFSAFKLFSKILVKLKIHKIMPFIVKWYDSLFAALYPNDKIVIVQRSKMYLDVEEKNVSLRRTFQAYASNKIHEKSTTELFEKSIKSGDVFVDFGANIGYFTLLGAKIVGPKGKVFCFEPEPTNFMYLNKNIELNRYKNVYAYQKAVSNVNGKTDLFICEYDTGHHTINKYDGIDAYKNGRPSEKKSIVIDTVRLDDFLKDKTNKVDVMKVDAEGSEFLAIQGMDNILKTNKNIKIVMEYFPLLIRNMGSKPEELITTLINKYGFSIYVIPDDYNAGKQIKHMLEISSSDQLNKLCANEQHINLFLERK
jgi:FkbM family methyltransferase